MKSFNVTGTCIPGKHYMVDISGKLSQIKEMVDKGLFFTINKGRQYGKTTTFFMLKKALNNEYIVAKTSFESIDYTHFESPEKFCKMFMEIIHRALKSADVSEEYAQSWIDYSVISFDKLREHISKLCKGKKIVLMIDEVDKSSNHKIYIHFLGMLRDQYLLRNEGEEDTFYSVILAGVYDIKNIKLKMINEGNYSPAAQEGKIYNSPWNIAASFDVDMSFNPREISTMLIDYENDHHTGMDIMAISEEIYKYTSGYPFLVSRICKEIDEKLDKDWTADGLQGAIKRILEEKNTLFDDLFKNLESNKELYDLIYSICVIGENVPFHFGLPAMDLGFMFGILKNQNGKGTKVSNIMFEILIYNYFILKDKYSDSPKVTGVLAQDVITEGRFNMQLCLEKFAGHYTETFAEKDIKFLERNARQVFLTYLRPLINGQGFYHMESELLDQRRMDIVLDFNKEQFIIELKIWRGEQSHEEAYEQLSGYLDTMNMDTGYLLTFDFRKNHYKDVGCDVKGVPTDSISTHPNHGSWISYHGKKIFDVIV